MTSAASFSPSTIPPRPSFLEACREDLNPEKITMMDKQSTLWNVAANVTFVAFTALAVGAFVVAGISFPAYMPFVGLSALIAAMPVANFVKNFIEYAAHSNKESNTYREIQHNATLLSRENPEMTQYHLLSRGIKWWEIPGASFAHPENITSLHPILAKAMQLDSLLLRQVESIQECRREVNQLEATPPNGSIPYAATDEGRKKIYDIRNAALMYEDRVLHTKIEAAFVNAVLRKGDFHGTLDDIATVSNLNFSERLAGYALGQESSVNKFLTFKNRALTPITYEDLQQLTIAELGLRIRAAMV